MIDSIPVVKVGPHIDFIYFLQSMSRQIVGEIFQQANTPSRFRNSRFNIRRKAWNRELDLDVYVSPLPLQIYH